MKYLITSNNEPILTNWFEAESHFKEDENMIVYDLTNEGYTKYGINWFPIDIERL